MTIMVNKRKKKKEKKGERKKSIYLGFCLRYRSQTMFIIFLGMRRVEIRNFRTLKAISEALKKEQ